MLAQTNLSFKKMDKKIIKFFDEISKLSKKQQKTVSDLSYFQYQVISYLRQEKKDKIVNLINLDKKTSRAQRYRYIKHLIKTGLCKTDKLGFITLN